MTGMSAKKGRGAQMQRGTVAEGYSKSRAQRCRGATIYCPTNRKSTASHLCPCPCAPLPLYLYDIGNFGHTDVLSTFGGSKKGGVGD